MHNLELIAAIGKNNELGFNNNLIWHIKEDMKQFKKITMNKTMIMGMNTYNSMPKNLEGRKYIVLTRKKITIPNVLIFNSKEELLNNRNNNEKYIIVGGGQIYNLFINDVDIMYLTHIDQEYKLADAFFPSFNEDLFDKELLMEGNDKVAYKQYKYIRR